MKVFQSILIHKKVYTTLPRATAYMAWTEHTELSYYYNFADGTIIQIQSADTEFVIPPSEEAYVAITQGVPKSFKEALRDPVWKGPSQVEWNQFCETQAMTEVDPTVAKALIKEGKADLVIYVVSNI